MVTATATAVSPKAAVLMAMEPKQRAEFLAGRVRADRDPSIEDVMETLYAVARRSRGLDPEDWPERVLRRHPHLMLAHYVRAMHRRDLEQKRRWLLRELIGTAREPIPLTPDAAERLVALVDSWARRPDVGAS